MVFASQAIRAPLDSRQVMRQIWGQLRVVTLIASIIIAYPFSLADLVRSMRFDTPLAYLGLVPLLALAIGWWRFRSTTTTSSAPTGWDVAAGGALLCLAVLVSSGLPIALNSYAWSKRLDLLSLPVFAMGMVILLYGSRALDWAWSPLFYLCLVWTVPYDLLIGHVLVPLTDLTARVVGVVSERLPLGATVDSVDPTLFAIATASGSQQVSIGSACAGFNSLVAWFLVGMAVCTMVTDVRRGSGAVLRRVGWLALGLILTLVANVVRILGLFAVIHIASIGGAFDTDHALLGMLLFATVALTMLVMLPVAGLALPLEQGHLAPVPLEREVSPVRAAFIALGALLLAVGSLLGLTVTWAVLGLISTCIMMIFIGLDLSLIGLAAPATAKAACVAAVATPQGRALRQYAPMGWAGWCIGGGILLIVSTVAYVVQGLADALQAVGWQIGAWQQVAMTGPVRFIVAALVGAGGLIALRGLLRARRYLMNTALPFQIRPLAGWQARASLSALIILGTLMLALTNVTVASFGMNASASRVPTADFDAMPAEVPGMTRTFEQSYDWTKQFLGETSTYNRHRYDLPDGGQSLWLDVMTTEDPDTLAYHQVHNCYAFHGFVNEGEREISIGNGVTAGIVNYYKGDVGENWTTLYWEQRIVRDGRVFYQRIVMLYVLEGVYDRNADASQFVLNNTLMQARASEILQGLVAVQTAEEQT